MLENVVSRGLQKFFMSCQVPKHLLVYYTKKSSCQPVIKWFEIISSNHLQKWSFHISFRTLNICIIFKFRFRQKKFWPRNRYRNLILVSVADTETRFRSYTSRRYVLLRSFWRLFTMKIFPFSCLKLIMIFFYFKKSNYQQDVAKWLQSDSTSWTSKVSQWNFIITRLPI